MLLNQLQELFLMILILDRTIDENKNSKKLDFFNLENIDSKSDFIKARAEFDSSALKKKIFK